MDPLGQALIARGHQRRLVHPWAIVQLSLGSVSPAAQPGLPSGPQCSERSPEMRSAYSRSWIAASRASECRRGRSREQAWPVIALWRKHSSHLHPPWDATSVRYRTGHSKCRRFYAGCGSKCPAQLPFRAPDVDLADVDALCRRPEKVAPICSIFVPKLAPRD